MAMEGLGLLGWRLIAEPTGPGLGACPPRLEPHGHAHGCIEDAAHCHCTATFSW